MAGRRFRSHGLTDQGLVRERNEDALLDRPELGLWAVADGMGGHQCGDEASAAVVAALAALTPPADLEDFVDELKTRLLLTDRALRQRAVRLGPGAVIASTVAALLACGDDFAAIWAGDSRLYHWRDGNLVRLSTDHSQVQELVAAGRLTEAAARYHPAAHVVTQAIGAGRLTFGTRAGMIRAGDRFLLCSDGLTGLVDDTEIAGELGAGSPHEAAERLHARVLARGAFDNVTILVVAAEPD